MTRSFAAAAAFLTIGSLASTAFGQEDASATAAARTIGTEGLRLAESGNCKEAIEKLERAEKLHHAPTTLQKLGECQLQAGKLVVGLEALRRVARESLPADAPPVFQAAKQRAQLLLDQNAGKVAQLHVTVTLPAGVAPIVTVDGEAVPSALVDVDRPTDPGSHVVEVTAPGFRKATQTVTLKEGERTSITLALDAEPNAPAPAGQTTGPTTSEPVSRPASPPSTKTTRTVAYALYGAGAAGLVVGTVFGAVALGKKGGLNDDCPEQADGSRLCNANRTADDRTSLKTFATVSTVGFVVGGVGLVGGTIALLFSRSAAKGGTLGGLQLGPTSVGYRGSF